ncbi:MAG: hypothetical protein V1977_04890 [Candidatus Diapherotrites archaeon]
MKPRRFSGIIEGRGLAAIERLKQERVERVKGMKDSAKYYSKTGGFLGTVAALTYNPSFREGVSLVATITAGGAIGGAAQEFANQAKKVNKATKLVGRGIGEEAQKNQNLYAFLKKHRYVYIDKKGRVIGTNRGRILWMGRMRLDTRKILLNEY